MTSLTPETTHPHEGPPLEAMSAIWSGELRSHGRRVTKQRLAVLAAVHGHPHSTAEEIVRHVREDLPTITVQSIYVVLADLTAIEMLRKFQPPGTPGLYETRTDDNHHHAFCIRCGRVEDVDCSVGEAPCLTPSESHGMTVLSADIVYRAICADCAAREAAEQESGSGPSAAVAP